MSVGKGYLFHIGLGFPPVKLQWWWLLGFFRFSDAGFCIKPPSQGVSDIAKIKPSQVYQGECGLTIISPQYRNSHRNQPVYLVLLSLQEVSKITKNTLLFSAFISPQTLPEWSFHNKNVIVPFQSKLLEWLPDVPGTRAQIRNATSRASLVWHCQTLQKISNDLWVGYCKHVHL